jgi:hypothetical protein
MMSGPLMDLNTDIENTWDAWGLDTFYVYETGCNEWNEYTTLLDADSQSVSVERPLKCLYTHSDGGIYQLDYEGEGELHGIPHVQLEFNEHEDFEMWVPVFTIADGTEIDCEGTPHYTRAMTVEKFMQALPEEDCGGLDIDATLTGPTEDYVDPELGDIPATSVDPKVVEGVVQ